MELSTQNNVFSQSPWFFLNCNSLTHIQKYSLWESLINSFEVPKRGKMTTTR